MGDETVVFGSGRQVLRMVCAATVLLMAPLASGEPGVTFYVDSKTGDDANDGLSPETAWRTLVKASGREYRAGDRILLRRGCVFNGEFLMNAVGTAKEPVIVDAYDGGDGATELPVIDAKGCLAGVRLVGCEHVEVSNLEITSDAGEPEEKEARTQRYGVLVSAREGGKRSHVYLKSLYIHDIFATAQAEAGGKNKTSNKGMGIRFFSGGDEESFLSDILVEDCRIERTGFTGIGVHCGNREAEFFNNDIRILNNVLRNIGGPGIQPGWGRNILVRGNVVDGSGSYVDERMHGRGSGIWPFACHDVLIERNKFMHARGKADSCGAHIDYNCKNVVVQYNLSLDNEGGFVEILGNDVNCAYRYNISINDGGRIKGKNGAHQEGKTFWLSGFIGKKPKTGPFNSYIYNNTIYLKPEIVSCFSVSPTTDSALVANNIFYLPGGVASVGGDQDNRRVPKGAKARNVIFANNICAAELPPSIFTEIRDTSSADPMFKNAGGVEPSDYAPTNVEAVKDKGVRIERLAGDEIGLAIGLDVESDYFGNKISGPPDIGAIELP
jgi:hypothetical protein